MKPHPTRRASPDIATAPLSSTHQVTAHHTLPQTLPRPPTLQTRDPSSHRSNTPTATCRPTCKPSTTPPPLPLPCQLPSSQPRNCPITSLTAFSSRSAQSRTQSQLGIRRLQRLMSRAAMRGPPMSFVPTCGAPITCVPTCRVPLTCVPTYEAPMLCVPPYEVPMSIVPTCGARTAATVARPAWQADLPLPSRPPSKQRNSASSSVRGRASTTFPRPALALA